MWDLPMCMVVYGWFLYDGGNETCVDDTFMCMDEKVEWMRFLCVWLLCIEYVYDCIYVWLYVWLYICVIFQFKTGVKLKWGCLKS
jgi:hypothetical protein